MSNSESNEVEQARSLLDQLLDESRLYKTSKDYLELLEFVEKLPHIAPFNAMLLHIQKPGLQYAASSIDWQRRFGRQPKVNARPLLIMWPFGPVALVYDVVDTEGKAFPEDVNAFIAHGPITSVIINDFIKRMRSKRIRCSYFDGGDGRAGAVRLSHRDPLPKENCYYDMHVNKNHSAPVQFVTIVHELAHVFLGHLGADRSLNIPARTHGDHKQQELEAESVAYLVSARSGVESKSKAYLTNYVDKNTTIHSLDIYQVMRAAGQIESLLKLTQRTHYSAPNT